MINYSDYQSGKEREKFTDKDGSIYEMSSRESLTLAETFTLAGREKVLSELGTKLSEGKAGEKDVRELSHAIEQIVSIALPTYPKDKISSLPIGLQIKLIQVWQQQA